MFPCSVFFFFFFLSSVLCIFFFRLFSDGGNFSPEEVEDYKKRLEKASQKIDSAEGAIMADLEGMESKKLEQATKITADFEERYHHEAVAMLWSIFLFPCKLRPLHKETVVFRFKHHMIDLVFVEKVARTLTNIQVKVKTEVADSNTQSQRLSHSLGDLDRRIDACERPSPDKEVGDVLVRVLGPLLFLGSAFDIWPLLCRLCCPATCETV